MIQKYFSIIIGIIAFIIFSSLYGWEYYNFHHTNYSLAQENKDAEYWMQNFSFKKIKKLENVQIFSTPEQDVLNQIIEKIETAKRLVYIEVYMLTEKRIEAALKKAKNNGVEIKIILEKNPYMAYNINNKAADFLEKNNIDFVWSNPDNYALNHTKLLLIDNFAILSTGNLTHSTFTSNREFFIFTQDKNIYNALQQIFLSDYNWKKQNIYNDNLVLSPFYSRNKLEYIIRNATTEICMYFPYFQDEALQNLLLEKSKNWIKIEIIIDKEALKSNISALKSLRDWGIKISSLNKYKMHSKAILIDNNYLFIGSINFSTFSLDKNREIWILLINPEILKNFKKIFKNEKIISFK